jgi:ELWxxDGT repeat protein
VELLEDRTLLSVALVGDVNTTAAGSHPSGFVNFNGAAYFFADDGRHGVELWKTDGTSGGTQLVTDLNPGSASAGLTFSPSPVVLGGAMYFFADSGAGGLRLWKSDGTAGGTTPLTPAAPGAVAYVNQAAADSAKGLVFFVDPSTGQLWKTDGTTTAAVKDGHGNPINFAFDPAVVGSAVYFGGQQSGSSGSQAGLWKTDGTQGGTSLVNAIGGSISDLTDVGGTAYFVVTTPVGNGWKDVALWSSNGTAANTKQLHDFGAVSVTGPSPVTDLTAFNGKLYFAAEDGTASPDLGTELWVSDTTGTRMVKDIRAGAGNGLGATPDLTVFNNSLYFLADSGAGQSLWRTTDGTAAHTTQVQDGQGHAILATAVLSAVNGSLYFAGSNAAGSGLWKTDGTASGTTFVESTSISAALAGSSAAVNGRVVFPAYDSGHGTELWANTGLVADINPRTSSEPVAITNINDTAFFLADDGNPSDGAVQLWKNDGTPGGLHLVRSFASGPAAGLAGAAPSRLLNVGGTVYFFAYDGNPADGAVQLWKSNGTAASTVLVKGFTPRQDGPFGYLDGLASTLTAVGGTVFFVADDGAHGLELWQTDGTAGGTTLVRDLNPGPGGSDPGGLTAVGSTLFFTASDGTHSGLWQTDGSTTTFVQAGASNLVNVNGRLFFTAPDAHNVPALWQTSGGSPALVASLGQGNSARLLTAAGSTLYFVLDGAGPESLWASTGAGGTTAALHAFSTGQPLSELTAVGSTLYFIDNASGGTQLWASKGTAAGTAEVAPVSSAAGFFGLTNVGGTLYFAASDADGQELWTSNGTAGGTARVQDLAPGAAGSFPHSFASLGGALFLAADDGTHGVELFANTAGTTRPGTSMTLTVSPKTVSAGHPVTLTATVHATQGTFNNGGSVTFFDGGTELGTVPVGSGGVAALSVVLPGGGHSITAVYSGDVHFAASPPQVAGVTVTGSQTATATHLSASAASTLEGQSVTFTAQVTPAPDGGAVDFQDGATDLGTVTIGPNGIAGLHVVLPVGTHHVVAFYSGDPGFVSSQSPTQTVTVTAGSGTATSTFLTASAASVVEGQSVTFTATVTASGGFDNGGQVDFWDGQVDLGSSGLNAQGIATLPANLSAGSHDVTAVYVGDAHFNGSMSGAVTVTITQPSGTAATDTFLDVSPATVTAGQSVSMTAMVASTQGTINGGTVEFVLDDQTDLGSAAVNAQGMATLSPDPTLPLGSHHITAVYSGDAAFAGSTSSPVDVTVSAASAAATETFLSGSATEVSTSDPVTFTATVQPTAGGNVDGGQVDFKDGNVELGGPVDVNAQGVATLTLTLSVGMHHVTAVYFGDASFAGSTSGSVTVTASGAAATTTTLSASASSVNAGDPVTFTASVAAASGAPRPADGGQVLFLDNGVVFASASVDPNSGAATLTTTLAPGLHHVTAAYQGNAAFAASTSSAVDVTVATPLPFVGDATPVVFPVMIPAPGHGAGHSGGFSETLFLWNFGSTPLAGPLYVVVHGIRSGVTLHGAARFLRRGHVRLPILIITPPAGVVQPFDVVVLPIHFSGGRPGAISVTVSAALPPT